MAEVGIQPLLQHNSYPAGIGKSIDLPLNYYSFIPVWLPLRVGFLDSPYFVSFYPIDPPVPVGIVADVFFLGYAPSIPINLVDVLTLPFTPLPLGFNQSLNYLSLQDAIGVNLIDVLSVPTIEYFVGFDEGLSYESSNASIAARVAIPGYLSGFPRGLENSLAELLGRSYSQNVDEIRIRKSDLLISDTSKPQYILAAIIFNALGAFTFSDSVSVDLWTIKVIDNERYTAITVRIKELE